VVVAALGLVNITIAAVTAATAMILLQCLSHGQAGRALDLRIYLVIAAALCIPLLGAGVWLGGRKFVSAAPENFRRMAISLLALLAMLGLVKSLL